MAQQVSNKPAYLVPLPPTGVGKGMIFPWICWSIWSPRNSLIFQKRFSSVTEVLSTALRSAKEWEQAQDSVSPEFQKRLPSNPRSDPSPLNSIFSDAAFVDSPLMAEALGILHSLQEAKRRGTTNLRLYSDSQVLIRSLINYVSIRKLHGILSDITSLASDFNEIDFVFVPRCDNNSADQLAKSALARSLFAQ